MTILESLQSASIKLGFDRKQTFFDSSDRDALELVDIANDVAHEICAYNEWQSLTKIHQITSDGITEVFPLPSDYDRQLTNTRVQAENNWFFGFEHIPDINQFIMARNMGIATVPGVWVLYQDSMHFTPAPPSGMNAIFPYISRNFALSQAGDEKSSFTQDTDVFRIKNGKRLLTLGIVWRWRENKKMDFSGDFELFSQELNQLAARDKGSRIQRTYRQNGTWSGNIAFPYKIGN